MIARDGWARRRRIRIGARLRARLRGIVLGVVVMCAIAGIPAWMAAAAGEASLVAVDAGPSRAAAVAGPARGEITIVVRRGDTLWDIAHRFGPAGADVRDVVGRIMRANGLATAMLRPGMELRIPAP